MRSRGVCARRRAHGVAAACGDTRGPARTRNDPTSRSSPSPMPSSRRHRWLRCAPPHSLRFGPSGAFARTPERGGPPCRPLLPRCDVRTWAWGTWAWGSPRCDEGGAPSWPWEFEPQTHNVWSASTAIACAPPACTAQAGPGSGRCSTVDWLGVGCPSSRAAGGAPRQKPHARTSPWVSNAIVEW